MGSSAQTEDPEAFWILCLGTRAPNGMNLRSDLIYVY